MDLLASQENQNRFIQNFDKILGLVLDLEKLKPYSSQLYQKTKDFVSKKDNLSSKVSYYKYIFLILSNLIRIDEVDYIAKLFL